jgi:starch phosphorylase
MSHLAFVGSHKINGVSALHTGLMRQTVFAALNQVCPDRIVNKTNGITFRRWLHRANPGLTRLLVDTIGEDFLRHPEDLRRLSAYVDDASLQDRMARQRLSMKKRLANFIVGELGVQVDPDAMFDVQVKRVHEYKRQLLNILQTVALYNAMRSTDGANLPPRVKIFAGKAAASYHQAKLIIRLIHDVARTINADPAVRGRLTVAFLPDYNVTLAENIIPAADVSEQISTAGMEASGTGNMKFMLNGGLTIGTLDGANVEILEHVGSENIVIFGLTADEVEARRRDGKIEGQSIISASPILAEVLRDIATGAFSPPDEPERYRGLVDTLTRWDRFMVTADFDAYSAAQSEVERRWLSRTQWWRTSLCNVAGAGWFSSDRTIREYAEEIWKVPMKDGLVRE